MTYQYLLWIYDLYILILSNLVQFHVLILQYHRSMNINAALSLI